MNEVEQYRRDSESRQRRWAIAGSIAIGIAVAIGLGIALWLKLRPAPDNDAMRAIESDGFTNILLGGAKPLSCPDGNISRAFEATNPAGKRVSGVVCCGQALQRCTLRW